MSAARRPSAPRTGARRRWSPRTSAGCSRGRDGAGPIGGLVARSVGFLARLPGVTAFYDDPDAALARVQQDIAQAQERAERAVEVKASIDRVRGRARSPRGEVEVETDATG